MELKIINLGNLIERNIANWSLDAIHFRYTNEPVAATICHADLIFRLRGCFLVLFSPPALTIGEKWETRVAGRDQEQCDRQGWLVWKNNWYFLSVALITEIRSINSAPALQCSADESFVMAENCLFQTLGNSRRYEEMVARSQLL